MAYSPPLGPCTPLALVRTMPLGTCFTSFSTPALVDWIHLRRLPWAPTSLMSTPPLSTSTSTSGRIAPSFEGSRLKLMSSFFMMPGCFLAAALKLASVT